jgi:hypothetical protein
MIHFSQCFGVYVFLVFLKYTHIFIFYISKVKP